MRVVTLKVETSQGLDLFTERQPLWQSIEATANRAAELWREWQSDPSAYFIALYHNGQLKGKWYFTFDQTQFIPENLVGAPD